MGVGETEDGAGASRRRSTRGRGGDRRTGPARRTRPDPRRSRSRSAAARESTPIAEIGHDVARNGAPVSGRSSHAGANPRRNTSRVSGTASGDIPAPPSRLALFAQRRGVSVTNIGIVVALGIFVMLTLSVPVRTYIAQRNEFKQLQSQNAELQRQTAEYKSRLAQQNDPAYVEQEARKRLQMVMRGDKPIVIVNPTRKQKELEQAAERRRKATPWYENLMDAVSTPPETRG